MGGSKSSNCDWAPDKYGTKCVKHSIWLSATQLPGRENTVADTESRHINHRTEWMLDQGVYGSLVSKFGTPTTDLFTSRLNKQCPVFAAWWPDPDDATFVDAFSANWKKVFSYAVSPSSLIGRSLEKIQTNRAERILVILFWTSQSWYPKLLRLLVDHPLLISHRERLLTLPGCNQLHPVRKKLIC